MFESHKSWNFLRTTECTGSAIYHIIYLSVPIVHNLSSIIITLVDNRKKSNGTLMYEVNKNGKLGQYLYG